MITLNMDDLCWLIAGGSVRAGNTYLRLDEKVANRSAAMNAASYADNDLGGIAWDVVGNEKRAKIKKLNRKC